MVRSNDPFWNDVEDMNNGGMKCKFCGHLFAENTSISRIKWHLSGVKGRGVKICEKVPEEVRNVVRAAMDGPPEKKLKTVAGSSNNCWVISGTQTHTNLRGSATCLLHGATGLY